MTIIYTYVLGEDVRVSAEADEQGDLRQATEGEQTACGHSAEESE